ncbi:MAG TPA: hypothetical protein PLI43_05465 [Albidovulum sp.]|uniref:hypothetical protein n=1 Tax=Albidovulum sp. TaxID=1872424 RepID=UPI002C4B359A|nr:hypothetical protein [Albidovulum sp.]
MQRSFIPLLVAAAILAMQPSDAVAYIGPGVGAGAVASVLGVISAIFLAIVAVVYYPIKRMLKGKGKPAKPASGEKAAK